MSPTSTPCKFGRRCTRQDCWFNHPDRRRIDIKEGAGGPAADVEQSVQKSGPPEQATPAAPFRNGQEVEYNSKSKRTWILCTIINISANGDVELDCKKGHPFPKEKATKYVRVRNTVGVEPAQASQLESKATEAQPPEVRPLVPKATDVQATVGPKDESSSDEQVGQPSRTTQSKFGGTGLKKLFHPAQASATEDDPVYTEANEEVPPWPMTISPKKKLVEAQYQGGGWPLHFRNPQTPRRQIGTVDLERVAMFLRKAYGSCYTAVTIPSAGIAQIKLGHARGSGTIQVYTSTAKLGRPEGNARISIGSETRVKEIRACLLQSKWFCDAVPGLGQTAVEAATIVFQPDGSLMLPPLSAATPEKCIRKVLKSPLLNWAWKAGRPCISTSSVVVLKKIQW